MQSKLLMAFLGLLFLTSTVEAGRYRSGESYDFNPCVDSRCVESQCYDNRCCPPPRCCPPEPCCACDYPCYNWYLYGDWLYWKVRRSALDYATYGDDNELLGPGKIERLDPNYEQGFRVGLYFVCDNRWTFGARYTYFHTDHSESLLRTEQDLFATRIHPAECSVQHDENEFAHCKYKLDLDMVDAEVGFTINFECLDAEVRPFIGGRFAFIDERLDTLYDQTRTKQGLVGEVAERVCLDGGYGMLTGVEGTWNVKGPFNIFARVSGGMLFADYNSRFVEEDKTVGDEAVCVNTRDNEKRVISCFDMIIGGELLLCQSHRGTLALRAGYEFHSWHNTKDFLGFVDDVSVSTLRRNNSALGFDGLFVRIHLPY